MLATLCYYLDYNGQTIDDMAKVQLALGDTYQAVSYLASGITKGLKYGNIWSHFLKLYEQTMVVLDKSNLDLYVRLAKQFLPREVLWKIYLDLALTCERKQNLDWAQEYLVQSVLCASDQIKWRPYLQIARIELVQGRFANAEKIISALLSDSSEKQRNSIYLEASKIYEYAGYVQNAQQMFEHLQDEMRNDWKVTRKRRECHRKWKGTGVRY